jgi:hypothetical protein
MKSQVFKCSQRSSYCLSGIPNHSPDNTIVHLEGLRRSGMATVPIALVTQQLRTSRPAHPIGLTIQIMKLRPARLEAGASRLPLNRDAPYDGARGVTCQ